jgi:hypothetical protein
LTALDSPFHTWSFPDGTEWLRFYRTGQGYRLLFPGLAEFTVSREGEVLGVEALNGTSQATLDHLYLNQVLPLAMSRQGKLVFHGSAVEAGDGAAAFLGESGRGKSTIAAAFATRGAGFLTDDGLRVEFLEGQLLAYPSHPSIRLWEDSQEALVGDDAQLAPSVEYTTKARILADDAIRFCNEPKPLRRIYFLDDDGAERLSITRLSPSEALVELTKHSFLLDIEERELIAHHFDRLAEMVKQPVFFKLDYPRRYEDLDRVRRAILDDLGADR